MCVQYACECVCCCCCSPVRCAVPFQSVRCLLCIRKHGTVRCCEGWRPNDDGGRANHVRHYDTERAHEDVAVNLPLIIDTHIYTSTHHTPTHKHKHKHYTSSATQRPSDCESAGPRNQRIIIIPQYLRHRRCRRRCRLASTV